MLKQITETVWHVVQSGETIGAIRAQTKNFVAIHDPKPGFTCGLKTFHRTLETAERAIITRR